MELDFRAMAKSTPLSIWLELNQRQKSTLIAIYKADQNAEQDEAARWRMGWKKRPAKAWRNLRYAPLNGHETFLHRQMREAGVIDEGLGSTLAALERRKLIECNYYEVLGKSELLSIKLTNTGRAVTRAGLGEKAPRKRPKGQLKERQWEALVAVYLVGNEGLKSDGFGDYGGFSWRWTWLRLRDYFGDGSGLIKEESKFVFNKTNHRSDREYFIVISEAGRKFYEENWRYYQELYPDVDAPEP